ncbi:MAG: UDP-2,3-diacylglucosamine diphosphatase [Candidatus Marithrix sp.]|nr:UDP-2,3-diacylglucosamine diphosphatase [Candidatus Marithrix sp.]
METLFIADLHLSPTQSNDFALEFLADRAKKAEALYVLGDLFEMWLGDDDTSSYQEVLASLQALTIPIFVMHGNRDFLLGKEFSARTGCQLISDPYVIDLYGTPTLLMHGDTLCTLDTDYQAFRQQVRDPNWQKFFLAQPLEIRRKLANQARDSSQAKIKNTNAEIMDVTPNAVNQIFSQYNINQLIHGHTHRPYIHKEDSKTRWVLGDWTDDSAIILVCDTDRYQLVDLL